MCCKVVASLVLLSPLFLFVGYLMLHGIFEHDGIFVISLQGSPGAHKMNQGRLDSFIDEWAQSCGSTALIEHCPGVHDSRRGFGLTKSWVSCLKRAQKRNFSVTIILEDDARLFQRQSSLSFCDVKQRRRLWSNIPDDAFIIFLGGHSWNYPEAVISSSTLEDNTQGNVIKFRKSTSSFGTYGFAVPRRSFDLLLGTMRDDLAQGFHDENGVLHQDFLSPEKSWYQAADKFNKAIYVVNPLMVRHEGGFSNTWMRSRDAITGEESDNASGIRGVAA